MNIKDSKSPKKLRHVFKIIIELIRSIKDRVVDLDQGNPRHLLVSSNDQITLLIIIISTSRLIMR